MYFRIDVATWDVWVWGGPANFVFFCWGGEISFICVVCCAVHVLGCNRYLDSHPSLSSFWDTYLILGCVVERGQVAGRRRSCFAYYSFLRFRRLLPGSGITLLFRAGLFPGFDYGL